MSSPTKPPQQVLDAFELVGSPKPLCGGQNSSWIINNAILKPCSTGEDILTAWISDVQSRLCDKQIKNVERAYRLARPIRTTVPTHNEGTVASYIHNGWTATERIDGYEDLDLDDRIHEIMSASRAMHNDLKDLLSQPNSSVSERTDRWAQAERIAWDEITFADISNGSQSLYNQLKPFIDRLDKLKRPFTDTDNIRRQLVHGDLSGNILFAPRGERRLFPPGIIDFTPQWRPVEFAEAVVLADALTWQGCTRTIVEAVGLTELRLQMLVRALIFRVVTYTIEFDEEFVARTLGNMDIEHALTVVEGLFEELLQPAI